MIGSSFLPSSFGHYIFIQIKKKKEKRAAIGTGIQHFTPPIYQHKQTPHYNLTLNPCLDAHLI